MKKIFSFIMSLVLAASCLSSCSSYMEKYEDERIGISYELPASLEYIEYSSEANVYKTYRERSEDGSIAVLVEIFFVSNEDLSKNEAFASDLTLEKYITYNINEVNGIDESEVEIEYSDDKNKANYDFVAAESENTVGIYTYYTFIKNDKGICRIEMSCNEMLVDSYAPKFIKWGKKIRAI